MAVPLKNTCLGSLGYGEVFGFAGRGGPAVAVKERQNVKLNLPVSWKMERAQ